MSLTNGELRFNMEPIMDAAKLLSAQAIRAAIPADGSDSKPIRLTYIGPEHEAGTTPLMRLPVKYQITWEVTETADGDWTGKIVWSLLGYGGEFPAVMDYTGLVPPSAHPTFWQDEQAAKNCAATCADILRMQFVELFHQEGTNGEQGQS